MMLMLTNDASPKHWHNKYLRGEWGEIGSGTVSAFPFCVTYKSADCVDISNTCQTGLQRTCHNQLQMPFQKNTNNE
jgi:hypothetical protein